MEVKNEVIIKRDIGDTQFQVSKKKRQKLEECLVNSKTMKVCDNNVECPINSFQNSLFKTGSSSDFECLCKNHQTDIDNDFSLSESKFQLYDQILVLNYINNEHIPAYIIAISSGHIITIHILICFSFIFKL